MEQKIELEIRLRELASQSLLEARNEIDVLEVEKSLLTSDQRMNCYASKLEAQRKQMSDPSLSTDSGRASKTSNRRREGSLGRSSALGAGEGSSVPSIETGSPSFSSQSSPSKCSPVSGESTNTPAAIVATSPESKANERALSGGTRVSGSSAASSYHRPRRMNYMLRQPTDGSSAGASNTLGNRRNQRATRSKTRERLGRSIMAASNIDCNTALDNKATVIISELRIPLMWRDVDHFKGRGDYRRYAVFCLLKIGSQIYDTQLISDVDRQMTDLNFDDVIVFNDIDHEFKLTLEVYSCAYLERFSLSSTPRKLKEKLSNSIGRAMGRRLTAHTASANFTKELEAYDKSYRFAMIASAKLGLPEASDSIKTYDLHLVSPQAHGRQSTYQLTDMTTMLNGSTRLRQDQTPINRSHSAIVTASNQRDIQKNTLPLFGHLCCKLHVRPDVFDKCIKSGYLKVSRINLADLMTKQQLASDVRSKESTEIGESPLQDSGKSSSSNDELFDKGVDQSMLRSALAASSKLATIALSTATVHWGLLRNFTLHLWHVDERKLETASRRGHQPQVDISDKQPFCVGIDKFTRLLRVSNSSMTIETAKGCYVIALYNTNAQSHGRQDDIGQWLRPIEQMIYDSHIWGSTLNHFPNSQRSNQTHL